MKWLQTRTVLTIHRLQIAEHGGEPGVRDAGLLESALARPVNRFNYDAKADAAALGAAYAFGISSNHPFTDGNKRTALVAMETFLRINGFRLATDQEDKYLTFMRLAEGRLDEDELAEWVRARIVRSSG